MTRNVQTIAKAPETHPFPVSVLEDVDRGGNPRSLD